MNENNKNNWKIVADRDEYSEQILKAKWGRSKWIYKRINNEPMLN
jgi:hypothetical protein